MSDELLRLKNCSICNKTTFFFYYIENGSIYNCCCFCRQRM